MSQRQTSLCAWIVVAVFVPLFAALIWSGLHSPDAQVARGLVEAAYRTASNGSLGDLPEHWEWQAIDQKYGRVLHWKILSSRYEPLSSDWSFDVQVIRQRAVTQEAVEAMAGPSRLHGYISKIMDVRVESARPLSKT